MKTRWRHPAVLARWLKFRDPWLGISLPNVQILRNGDMARDPSNRDWFSVEMKPTDLPNSLPVNLLGRFRHHQLNPNAVGSLRWLVGS